MGNKAQIPGNLGTSFANCGFYQSKGRMQRVRESAASLVENIRRWTQFKLWRQFRGAIKKSCENIEILGWF